MEQPRNKAICNAVWRTFMYYDDDQEYIADS